MRVIVYSLLRLGLLVAFGGLLYAVGLRGPLLLVAAFVGSGVVSVFALRDSRARAGEQVGGFFTGLNARIDAAAAAEDTDDAGDTDDADSGDAEAGDSGGGVTPPSTSAGPRTAD